MNFIISGQSPTSRLDGPTKDAMYQLRYEMFFKRLRWEVEVLNGREIDGFDSLDPTYIVSKDQAGRVDGCWRLLPTTGNYMLRDVFPQLLRGEAAPQAPSIWEISRFAIAASGKSDSKESLLHPIALGILQRGYEFAKQNGIHYFVAVTSVAMERLLKSAGIPMRRFGDRKAIRVGRALSVACWIDVNEQFRQAAYAKLNRLRSAA